MPSPPTSPSPPTHVTESIIPCPSFRASDLPPCTTSTDICSNSTDGWTTCVDETTDETYYWNTITNETTWDNPYAVAKTDVPLTPSGVTHTTTVATTTAAATTTTVTVTASATSTTSTSNNSKGNMSAVKHASAAVLPGSAPTTTVSTTNDFDTIHPSRRGNFGGTTMYHATAASQLDRLLHSIDGAKSEPGGSIPTVSTTSSNTKLSTPLAIATGVTSIRPTAVSSSRLLHTAAAAASPIGSMFGSNLNGNGQSPFATDGYGMGSGSRNGHDVIMATSTSVSTNPYFDERAYQEQRNAERLMALAQTNELGEQDQDPIIGQGDKRRRIKKSELARYRAKKEEHKRRKYLSKFANM